MNPEEFRAAAHELVDWIADYRLRVDDLPVRSQVHPGEVRAQLQTPPPETPQSFSELMADLENVIVPGLTHVQSANNFAWFPANSSLSSVLGDFASTGLGALGITWQSAPALTEVEELVTEWLRELTGLSPEWKGAIHDGASTAALVALLIAREKASNLSLAGAGLQGEAAPLIVYSSPQAHSSIVKAALLVGFGQSNLRMIEVDETTFAMKPESMRAEIEKDIALGNKPAAIVVAIGTTGTTAIDPIKESIALGKEFGIWVHVDAAMAGSAMLLPECAPMFDGVNEADSISWNPHKWLGTSLDCALLYVRDVELMIRVLSTNPSYLKSGVDGEVTQFKDWGLPLGRRFRALKLWFHLRLDGAEAIRARLRRDLANAQWLAEQVAATQDWEIVAPVSLQTVCVRHIPKAMAGDWQAIDAHTQNWVEAVNASGKAFITPSVLQGHWMVRVSIGVLGTEREHVTNVWNLMQEAAQPLNSSGFKST